MSNSQISTFDFKSNPVRVELFKNEPHFCLVDVCIALDISNAKASRFKLNEKGVHKMYTLTNGGKQELTFINEPNLYRIIFRSNKANAVEFQNWVFEEVLPQIRKTGKYQIQQQLALPEPEKKFTLELTESELKTLCWLWKMASIMSKFIGAVQKPLELLQSKLDGAAWGYSHEYPITIDRARKILERATVDIKTDVINSNGWNNVIHELRKGDTNTSY